MPDDTLWPHEVDELVAEVHAAQREQAAIQQMLEADATFAAADESVVEARLALDAAMDAREKARAPYAQQLALAADKEVRLRELVLRKWPHAEGKTIGAATVSTRAKLVRLPSASPSKALSVLQRTLPGDALDGVLKDVVVDEKALLPLLPVFKDLREVYGIHETRTLSIRKEA